MCLQVVFGLPLLLFPSGAYVTANLWAPFWFLVQSCICLIIFHLRFFPYLLFLVAQRTFWTMQVFFHLLPCHHHPLFVFHVSHPYSKTGAIGVLYSFRFVLLEVFLEHQILFNVENAPLVVRVCFSGLLYHLSPISQISELTYFFYSLSSYKNHFLVLCINCH